MTKIIQCPSCSTKFALNESQLSGVSNPKFQCSRCQTVFNLFEDNNSNEPEEIAPPPPPPEEKKIDPLEGFKIDLNKFTLGNPSTGIMRSIKEESSPAFVSDEKNLGDIQLGFGFSNPEIERNEIEQKPPVDENSSSAIQGSLRDSPTKITKRLDSGTLESIIYSDSGEGVNPIAVGWDEGSDDKEEHLADYRESREALQRQNETTNISHKDSGNLESIFRPGSQRSSTGSHSFPSIKDASPEEETQEEISNYNSSPSWNDLKGIITNESEDPTKRIQKDQITTDLTIQSTTIEPNFKPFINDPSLDDSANRSMKHTTVMQRDTLDVEGFLKPFEETDDAEEELRLRLNPLHKLLGIKNLILNFKPANLKLSKPGQLSPFTISTLKAWSIPFLLLFVLFFWGQSLSNKDKLSGFESSIANVLGLFSPREVILPPINLVLNTLAAELRPDKNGDPMIVISGTIFNAGIEEAIKPTLEARTYDKNNRQIKSIQAPIPNELSRFASAVNLVELRKEEILKLQNIRSWNSINPGKALPFKVVVTDIEEGYKYFSAKIYSLG